METKTTTPTDLIERVASAIHETIWPQCEWPDETFCRQVANQAAIAALASSAGSDDLVRALLKCRELFREIRMDWSDPRDEIREGLETIDSALESMGRV